MPSGARLTRVATLLAVCGLLSACGSTAASDRSALQKQIGTPGGISATELRLRLYELPQQLGGIVEVAADQIRAKSTDPAARRRALLWEADGIPALYAAALRPDPLAGGLDLAVFVYQMEYYLEDGAGKDAFGPQQEIAVGAVQKMVKLTESTASSLYTDQAVYLRRKARLQEFARAHPIDGSFLARETAISELARFAPDESAGALAAVGTATDTLEDISLRLNAYITLLPKVTRWQAVLATEDITGRDSLGATVDDLHSLGVVARRADALLTDLPGAVREAREPLIRLLDEQRTELLAAVARERLAMTGFITAEREAALAALGEERRAAMASISEERAAVLAGLDALTRRTLEDASVRGRGMARNVFWGALILIVASALLFAAAFRFARSRPRVE